MNFKLTPEVMILLPFFAMLDLIGWVLICFGADDFGITDALGFLIGGSYVLFSGGKLPDPKKTGFKFFTTLGIEMFPYIGSISPTWTLWFLNNLQEKNKKEEQQKIDDENQDE